MEERRHGEKVGRIGVNAHPKLLRSPSAVEDPAAGANGSEDYDGNDYGTARSDHLGIVPSIRQAAGRGFWIVKRSEQARIATK